MTAVLPGVVATPAVTDVDRRAEALAEIARHAAADGPSELHKIAVIALAAPGLDPARRDVLWAELVAASGEFDALEAGVLDPASMFEDHEIPPAYERLTVAMSIVEDTRQDVLWQLLTGLPLSRRCRVCERTKHKAAYQFPALERRVTCERHTPRPVVPQQQAVTQ